MATVPDGHRTILLYQSLTHSIAIQFRIYYYISILHTFKENYSSKIEVAIANRILKVSWACLFLYFIRSDITSSETIKRGKSRFLETIENQIKLRIIDHKGNYLNRVKRIGADGVLDVD